MSAASLESFPILEGASLRGAELTANAAREAVAKRGRFALALSGGTTPARYLELLAAQELPWQAVHVFWADERLVEPESPDSNCHLARERLLSRVPVPEGNVHPMVGGAWRSQEQAAQAYETLLRGFFGNKGLPVFDVIHLGLGGDGHTASLFPGQPALGEQKRLVVPVEYAKASPPVARLTLTLPVINAARLVFFLVSGPDKARLAREIQEGNGEGYPASLIRPAGRLVWLLGEK